MKRLFALMLLAVLALSTAGCTPLTGNSKYTYLPKSVHVNGSKESVEYIYDDNMHLQKLSCTDYFGPHSFPVTTDRKGNVLSYEGQYRESDDVIAFKQVSFTYTKNGKLLTSKENGTIKERTYDSKGLLKSLKRTRSSYVVYMECEYDRNENLISIYKYRDTVSDENLYMATELSYNEQGQRTQEVCYDGDGNCIGSVQYSYTDSNTIAQLKRFTTDGNLHNTTTFTFDACGNLIEQQVEGKDYNAKSTYTYEYIKVPISSAPQNVYVYHKTLPELDIFDWYDFSNV